MPVRLLIADDHAVVRYGLRLFLEAKEDIDVVGEARDGRDALEQSIILKPDIVIMDFSMPNMNGIEATQLLGECSPSIKVIMLSMHQTSEHVSLAMQAGACAYILKDSASVEIVKAIHSVMKGRKYIGENLKVPLPGTPEALKSPIGCLCKREREVFQLVAEGKSSSQIAEILSMSPKSVKTYRCTLMNKLSLNNIPSLVKFALQYGFTPAQ